MSTLTKPHIPVGSEPSRDDDPTGVRALLSSMPEPGPMPEHLVERITASLAAEQAQRAATMSGASISGASVTPLLATARRRPSRLWFAIAGAAAVVALVAVAGSNMLTAPRRTESSTSAAVAGRAGPQSDAAKAPSPVGPAAPSAGPAALSPTQIGQITQSGTRYTQAGFVTQARTLRRAAASAPTRTQAGSASGVGPAGTTAGLTDCLSAIGAAGAQQVRADVAFYEGRPAVIIVATTNGVTVAYAVGRQCSHADAAVLRPATPLS